MNERPRPGVLTIRSREAWSGGTFMSLIHSAELADIEPFEHLIEPLKPQRKLSASLVAGSHRATDRPPVRPAPISKGLG